MLKFPYKHTLSARTCRQNVPALMTFVIVLPCGICNFRLTPLLIRHFKAMNNCGIVEFNDFFSVNPLKEFAKDSDTRKEWEPMTSSSGKCRMRIAMNT